MKDYAFASLVDKNDLPYLYKFAEKIRNTHDNNLVNEFNSSCQKKFNDHNPVLHISNRNIEFIQVSKADDLIVNTGIDQFIKLILGIDVTGFFKYMAVGTGTTAVAVSQTALTGFYASMDMTKYGWREWGGQTLRFGGIFGEVLSTQTVTESGVFTGAGTGIMLNRNMFSNLPILHVINQTGFIISSVIEFVPVI